MTNNCIPCVYCVALCLRCIFREYNPAPTRISIDDMLEKDRQKKRERYEASRQASLKDSTVNEIAQTSRQKRETELAASSTTAISTGAKGTLTIYPENDREYEAVREERAAEEALVLSQRDIEVGQHEHDDTSATQEHI